MTHQSLGNTRINGVVAHRVAVVGTPAQSQLTEVAGSITKPPVWLAMSISTWVRSRA